MQYIDFKVQHQTITRTDKYEVVGGSQNYLHARFTFCAEWADMAVVAVFSTNSGKHYSVAIENGECLVPWEVLLGAEFWVGVFGGDRLTTSTTRVPVKPGVKLNASPGGQPTPSAYEALVKRVEDAMKNAPFIGDNGNWWIGEEDTGIGATEPGPPGPKGETGAAIPLSGFVSLSVDEEGNLYAYSTEDSGIGFEFDSETGNLYVVQEV